jgi:hypothetical protein
MVRTKSVPVLLLSLMLSVPAYAQLNGAYSSEGHGTIGGFAVSTLDQWVFAKGELTSVKEQIIFDAGTAGIDGTAHESGNPLLPLVNAYGALSAVCRFRAITPSPLNYQVDIAGDKFFASRPDTINLSTAGDGGCPFGHSVVDEISELYTVLVENGGTDFSYSEFGGFTGGAPDVTVSISGHGKR